MGKIYHANNHSFATVYVPEQAIFLHHNDCEAQSAVHSFMDTQQADLIEANSATVAAVYYLDGGLKAQQSIVAFYARYLERFSQVSINQANPSEEHPINRDGSARSGTALLSSVRRGFFTYRVTNPRLFERRVMRVASTARHEQDFITAPDPLPAAVSTASGPPGLPIHSAALQAHAPPSTDATRARSENPLIPLDAPTQSLSPMSPGNLAQALMTVAKQPDSTQPIKSENQPAQPPDKLFVCICGLDGNMSDLFADKQINAQNVTAGPTADVRQTRRIRGGRKPFKVHDGCVICACKTLGGWQL
jgi:hypothetical protein